jgi:hypothetical protein
VGMSVTSQAGGAAASGPRDLRGVRWEDKALTHV